MTWEAWRRRRLVTVVVPALWAVLAAFFVGRLAGRSLDDFFITYRYAWNLAHGHGFVFNPGERVFGVTEPGMVFWLAGWHLVTGVPIPWLGTASSAAGLLAVAALVLREGLRRGQGLAAALGGTLLMASTFLWAVHGAAVPLVLALLAGAAACAEKRPGWAGALACAAVWLRPDAAVGLAGLGCMVWWERRRFPWRFALVAATGLLIGCAAAGLYFGTVVPNTLGAKRSFAAWDSLARSSGLGFWPAGVPILRRHLGFVWPAILAVGAGGQVVLWRRSGPAVRILSLFGLSLALIYPLLGVPFFAWYAAPTVAALLLGLGFVAAEGAAFLASGSHLRPALAVALLALLAVPMALRGWRWTQGLGELPHYEAYRAAGVWIRSNSAPSAEISALEVGTLAYFSQRHTEDLLGLVTPAALPFVQRRDLIGAFRNHPTGLVVLKPSLEGLAGPLRGDRWFRKRYAEVARFDAGPADFVVVLGLLRPQRFDRRPLQGAQAGAEAGRHGQHDAGRQSHRDR